VITATHPRLILTGNEPRQRYLFEALQKRADVRAVVPFDEIDLFTKYSAAALSFSWPRSEWWGNYQMHPLLQRRRRSVLNREIKAKAVEADALLMWGSWFAPFTSGQPGAMPFVNYIDQSRSLAPLAGERAAAITRRKRSHALQADTYRQSLAILCMSEWARQQTLEAHDLPPDKVITAGWGPCAVDLSGESALPREREPIVLHVSNDFYRKGVDYLQDTAENVRRAVPKAKFVVIGRDVSGLSLRQMSNVEVLGPIYDRAVLANWFRRASVFLLPHRFDRSPHVLVEAMSAGLPIVVSEQGGAAELVNGTGVGIACPVGDIRAYSDAIIDLLSQPDLRQTMGERGLQLMRERYNWTVVSDTILRVIRERLSQSRLAQ
jgi:glycosyltransferase involved in cell wall biosynthesis